MGNMYIKALHIIFVVTWFAGLFYMVRLLIYNTEAQARPEAERKVLQEQYRLMLTRLWYGITWPSAVLTLVFGLSTLFSGSWHLILFRPEGRWLLIKLVLVLLLYGYHFSLQYLYKTQLRGMFRYSSQQLRVWNEVATIFLVAIVMLVVVKTGLSLVWALGGLLVFVIVLMSAIRIYKNIRSGK